MVVAFSTWLQLFRGRGVEERGGGSQIPDNSLHTFQGVPSTSSVCSRGGGGKTGLTQETLSANFGSEWVSDTGLTVGDRDVCGLFSLFRDRCLGSLYSPFQGLVTPPTTKTENTNIVIQRKEVKVFLHNTSFRTVSCREMLWNVKFSFFIKQSQIISTSSYCITELFGRIKLK